MLEYIDRSPFSLHGSHNEAGLRASKQGQTIMTSAKTLMLDPYSNDLWSKDLLNQKTTISIDLSSRAKVIIGRQPNNWCRDIRVAIMTSGRGCRTTLFDLSLYRLTCPHSPHEGLISGGVSPYLLWQPLIQHLCRRLLQPVSLRRPLNFLRHRPGAFRTPSCWL